MNEYENAILDISENLSDLAYEKFCDGAIQSDELNRVHKNISDWTKQGEELIKLIQINQ